MSVFAEGSWNKWKTLYISPTVEQELELESLADRECCIRPPNFFVENLGNTDAQWKVKLEPVPDANENVYVKKGNEESRAHFSASRRYYVVVDERDPPRLHGMSEEDMKSMTDLVTAREKKIPFWATGSKDMHTLQQPQDFIIGDGEIYGQ